MWPLYLTIFRTLDIIKQQQKWIWY